MEIKVFWKLLSLITLLSPLCLGTAQKLSHLLSSDSFFVLGAENLQDHNSKLKVFIDEFQSQDVLSALKVLFPDATKALPINPNNLIPQDYSDLTLLDLIGQETWIGLSASSFNPLPAITFLSRTSPTGTEILRQQIAEASSTQGTTRLIEGNFVFYKTKVETNSFPDTVVYAQVDDIILIGTNPENIRGVLRRLAGNEEPSLMTTDSYKNTLGRLGSGNFYGYINLPAVAKLATRFGSGFGMDHLVKRITGVINTSGVFASVLRITPDGLHTVGAQALNPTAGDTELLRLLSDPTPVPREAIPFIPETAIGVSLRHVNLTGWWNWLHNLAANTPDIGVDLDAMLFMLLGLDLRTDLLEWAGPQIATVTLPTEEVIEPEATDLDLLGGTVYLVETSSQKAAQIGLKSTFVSLANAVATFADPSGGDGNPITTNREVGNIQVTSMTAFPGATISFAIAGDFAVISTNPNNLDAVIEAFAKHNSSIRPEFVNLIAEVPNNVQSINVIDTGAMLELISGEAPNQLKLLSGLGGADNLDFDAVTIATKTIGDYLDFLSNHMGTNITFSQVKENIILAFGKNEISW